MCNWYFHFLTLFFLWIEEKLMQMALSILKASLHAKCALESDQAGIL